MIKPPCQRRSIFPVICAVLFAFVRCAHAANPETDEYNMKLARERATATATATATDSRTNPNIIIILADDVGTGDIPVYWNSSAVDMPNIKRLAEMGVTFKDAHASSICAPSRYMLLSGNYPHRGSHPNGSWGLNENRNQFRPSQKSIAEVLRDKAGYHTAMFGKWHLGAKAPPNGIDMYMSNGAANKNGSKFILTNEDINWNMPLIDGPQDIGFTKSYMTTGGIQSPPYSFFRDGRLTSAPSDITYWEEGRHAMPSGESVIGKTHSGQGDKTWDSAAYNMILVNETIAFIDNHLIQQEQEKETLLSSSSSPTPFFAYVALGSVHVPHSPPDRYLDDSPIKDVYPARHLDMLYEMDKVVGSLVSHIEDRNIANNTLIIFASDNGGLRARHSYKTTRHRTGGPLRGEKRSIYEGGHRVPLIMRYDNYLPLNQKRKKMVGLNDVYATICDIVGVDIPRGSAQDSISFKDYAESSENKSSTRTKFASWTYGNMMIKHEAIRYGSMKLIHNAFTDTFELYDLASDLSEEHDLSMNETYSTKMATMYRRLKAMGPCPNDQGGKFSIEGLKNKKGCGWFKEKTKRCRMHIEGELNCASVCGRFDLYCNHE